MTTAPQLTFPSIQDGASFRMPQETLQTRLQIADSATLVRGAHSVRFGGEVQRVDAEFRLGVFQQGRIELVQDFPTFDHNGDGVIDDNDLLFAVTLRSGKPDQALNLPDSDNTHIAGFVQDDWSVSNRLQLNLGLRYEIDTEVNNQSRVDELNPIVLPFVTDERQRDLNNFAPRVGFAWNATERGLRRPRRLRHLLRPHRAADPVARARSRRPRAADRGARRQRLLPRSGDRPVAAVRADVSPIRSPASSCRVPAPRASTSSIRTCRTRSVHEFHLGVEQVIAGLRARADVMHNQGTHFLIGRTVGEVFNPVVGGPDRVVNIESSARTKYDALLLSVDRPFCRRP